MFCKVQQILRMRTPGALWRLFTNRRYCCSELLHPTEEWSNAKERLALKDLLEGKRMKWLDHCQSEKEGEQRREKVGPINGGKFEWYSYKCPPREGIEFCFFYAVLPYEKVYLDGLPCAEMYEKSYMHRDIITHVLCTKLVHLDICTCVFLFHLLFFHLFLVLSTPILSMPVLSTDKKKKHEISLGQSILWMFQSLKLNLPLSHVFLK